MYNIPNPPLYVTYIHELLTFYGVFVLFGIYVFLDRHQTPCEISDIFLEK